VWSVYAAIGGGQTKLGYIYQANGGELNSLKHQGVTFVGGFGFRRYFTPILGLQARGSLLFGEGKGVIVGIPLDATVRLGSFAEGFPWFVGLGPFVGSVYGQRTGLDYSVPSAPPVERTGSLSTPFGGGVAEAGFLLGDGDRWEVAVRLYYGGTLSSSFGDVFEFVGGAGYRF
jgi:hypothetical protein